jgi:hypothetical protein
MASALRKLASIHDQVPGVDEIVLEGSPFKQKEPKRVAVQYLETRV